MLVPPAPGGVFGNAASRPYAVSATAINTAAVNDPEFVRAAAEKFGTQCIVVAIDAKAVESEGIDGRWEVFTHGGRNPTGLDAVEWARRMESYGAGEILLTSMDRDGTKSGFDVELTRAIADAVSIPVIASGGIASMDDIRALKARESSGIAGAIIGRALYDGGLEPAAALAAA